MRNVYHPELTEYERVLISIVKLFLLWWEGAFAYIIFILFLIWELQKHPVSDIGK